MDTSWKTDLDLLAMIPPAWNVQACVEKYLELLRDIRISGTIPNIGWKT